MPIPHPPKPSPNLLLHTHAPTFVRLPPPPPPCWHGRAWSGEAAITPSRPRGIHANTHLHANPAPRHLLFPYARISTETRTSMRVSSLQWLGAGISQARLPFPADLAEAALGVRRCCSGSGSLSLGRRRRPARRHLRLPPRRGRRRRQRRRPPAGAVASKATHLPHPSAAVPVPSRCVYRVGGVHAHLTSRHHPPRPGEHSH